MTPSIARAADYGIDYYLAVARGAAPGARPFGAYGRKTTVGADAGVLWPNGAFVFPPAAGVQLSIVSTSANDAAAGTGIRTADLHYLDANLDEQVETVTLNGLTPVLTVATDIRFVQCLHMVTWGSGAKAAGDISATHGGNTYGHIATGRVRCTSSVRMVPRGKRLLVFDLFAGSASGSAAAAAIVQLASPAFEGHDFTTANVFMPFAAAAYQDGSNGLSMRCPMPFTEGMSVGLTFEVDKTATIVGSWFGILEDA